MDNSEDKTQEDIDLLGRDVFVFELINITEKFANKNREHVMQLMESGDVEKVLF